MPATSDGEKYDSEKWAASGLAKRFVHHSSFAIAMASIRPDPGQLDSRPWIRRADQTALAAILLLCLAALACYWVDHGGHRGGMIDIDRADPRVVRYQVDINTTDWSAVSTLHLAGNRDIHAVRPARHPV